MRTRILLVTVFTGVVLANLAARRLDAFADSDKPHPLIAQVQAILDETKSLSVQERDDFIANLRLRLTISKRDFGRPDPSEARTARVLEEVRDSVQRLPSGRYDTPLQRRALTESCLFMVGEILNMPVMNPIEPQQIEAQIRDFVAVMAEDIARDAPEIGDAVLQLVHDHLLQSMLMVMRDDSQLAFKAPLGNLEFARALAELDESCKELRPGQLTAYRAIVDRLNDPQQAQHVTRDEKNSVINQIAGSYWAAAATKLEHRYSEFARLFHFRDELRAYLQKRDIAEEDRIRALYQEAAAERAAIDAAIASETEEQ